MIRSAWLPKRFKGVVLVSIALKVRLQLPSEAQRPYAWSFMCARKLFQTHSRLPLFEAPLVSFANVNAESRSCGGMRGSLYGGCVLRPREPLNLGHDQHLWRTTPAPAVGSCCSCERQDGSSAAIIAFSRNQATEKEHDKKMVCRAWKRQQRGGV